MLLKDLLPVVDKDLPIILNDVSSKFADYVSCSDFYSKSMDKYLEYEVKSLSTSNLTHSLVINVKKPVCKAYTESIREVKFTDFERGVYFGRYGKEPTEEFKKVKVCKCTAVKTPVECSCCGDTDRCERKQQKETV